MKKTSKILSLIIVATIVVCSLSCLGITANATSRSADEAINWVKSQCGKGIDYDGAYGCQCVDLIMAYYAYLGVSPSGGNGADYSWNALPSGWTRTAGGTPQKGDILVYTNDTYGHVAIFESTNSHFHQNYNGHGYVENVTKHSYNWSGSCYWGCIHPNFNTTPPHTHSYSASVTKQPTCTETGVRTYTCSCGSSYTESIAANGHSWDYEEIVTSAGCTTEGVKKFTCSVCSETKTVAISSTGHKPAVDEAVAPTCTQTGLSEGSHCSVCNAVIDEQKIVPATGHDYKLMSATVECEFVSGAFKCSVCGKEKKETSTDCIYSDWLEEEPPTSEDYIIEEKTQYCSAKKETKVSNTTLSGDWQLESSKIKSWSAWSNWSTTPVAESDGVQVEKNVVQPTYVTQYNYSRYVSADGKWTGPSAGYWNGIYCGNYRERGWGDRITNVDASQGFYIYHAGDGAWYGEVSRNLQTAAGYTQYRYRTAEYEYTYYRWSDFSNWQDEKIRADSETDVKTRTVYRLKYVPRGHIFADALLFDEQGHWHKCENCDQITVKEAHIYDNDSDTTCNECGYERNVIPVPENLTCTAYTKSTLTLSWDKVDGVKGYKIYNVTTGKSYKIKGADNTTYKIQNLKECKNYDFKICCFENDGTGDQYGEYSQSFRYCTRPSAVTVTKLNNSSSGTKHSFTVTHSTVKNVSGYEIKYQLVGSKNYKTYNRTNSDPKTIEVAKAGTYTVWIRAYKSAKYDGVNKFKANGDWSESYTIEVK